MIGFVVACGLLDLATVPPTIALCHEVFGRENGPIVFGRVSAAHAIGAGTLAFSGGVARGLLGSCTPVWIASGVLCAIAALMAVGLR